MRKTMIKCPYCGWEYLPAEIYFANYFLGHPENIVKDGKGTVIGYDGNDMDTTETFICDNCHKTFKVDAVVTFKTSAVKDVFDEDDDF